MTKNKILALKYRPQEFKDLIGQEVMAKTITNAIELGKTPNAYLLTGIRGVGKTTTARLIAKALNCIKNTDKNDEYVLTIETAGSLEPKQIVIAGIEELSKRLEEFKETIVNLK